jgi:hypothetical protein
MSNNKIITRLLCVVLISLCLLSFTACKDNNNDEIEWLDTVARPDIDALESGKYIDYPAKPENAPSSVDEDKKPFVKNYSASEGSGYTINEDDNGNTVVSYTEVQDWDYVYIEIDNYQSKYGNFKISASGNGAEKIAIQAIYYEMYNDDAPAVTVYQGDIADGSQYFVSALGEHSLLNKSYVTIANSKVREKTIIGFILFIDSNPSQMLASNKEGSLTITAFEFLEDGDPALKDRFVTPSVSLGFMDVGYSGERLEDGTIHIEREADTNFWTKVYLPIANYSSDYTAFNLTFDTTGVKSYKIQLEISTSGYDWQPSVDVLTVNNVTDGEHDHYIDFSAIQPTSSLPPYDAVPGYFIKNTKITSILVYLDTFEDGVVPDFAAACDIKNFEFERTVQDANQISKGWVPGSGNVTLSDNIITGGVGTVNITWHDAWYYLGMPVINYEKADKLVVKLAAPDGLDNLGIALSANGFEFVLHSGWATLNGNDTELEELSGSLEGIIETLEYDAETSIYTFTFDFTNAAKVDPFNIPLNEMQITLLRFYFNDPQDANDFYFEGTRTIRFINVSFE